MDSSVFPVFVAGTVIKGFGRGSKELGIPTANFKREVVDSCSEKLQTGIYYGWANVDRGEVYKMVMSVGWNPYYKNEHKSMETHIIHNYENDFYGGELRVCILGYIREERNFDSKDILIETIHNDIRIAETTLDKPEMSYFKSHDFFLSQ